MRYEYFITDTYPTVSEFVGTFLMARRNQTPAPLCYAYKVDNSREFSSQCETVLQEVKRAYNFTDREVKHYYFEERDVVVGDIACGEASLATQSAKDLFPL